MNNSKLTTTAKTFDTFVKIIGKILFVFGFVFIAFAILVLILGSKMYDMSSSTLDLDFVKLYLTEEYNTVTTGVKIYTCIGLVVSAAVCFIVYYGSIILRKILSPMKDGRPFSTDAPADLRKIAWLTLIGGAVTELSGVIERLVLSGIYPIGTFFSSDIVSKVEFSYSIDFGFVWVFAVIMFLSYIFSYGQKLQQESDETL